MSQTENPVLTVIRLLRRYLWIVKDDGSLANIYVSQEWYDRELLKNYDGQITVGLERSEFEKLNFDGSLRRKDSYLKVNVWAIDRSCRDKIVADVIRVIGERRNKPNVFDYNFVGVGRPTGTHKAYHLVSDTEPNPIDNGWNEFTDEEYVKIWQSDDEHFSKVANENGKYAIALFRFRIDAKKDVIKQLTLKFEGYGTAPAGNGIIIKIWNNADQTWDNTQTGNSSSDELLTISLTSNLENYLDENSYVYLLSKTAYPSDGTTPATLNVDCVEADFTINGITHCNIISQKDLDETRVKPFLWRTELMVKTLLFEKVLGG